MLTAPIGAIRAVLIRAGGGKICISTVRTEAASPAFQRTPVSQLKELSLHVPHRSRPQSRKDNLLLFPLILFLFPFHTHAHTNTHTHTHSFSLSDYSRYICNRLTCDLQSEGEKRGTYSLRWVYSSLALQMHQICYRKCDRGQA